MSSDIPIRAATDADVEGIVALIEDRIGEEDAPEARLVLEDPTFDRNRWSVAVDGDRVASTMATFPMQVRFGSALVSGTQLEFVATDGAYEGRGLVRRQFGYHHADLARRNELLQTIVGITYFYRRLGYEYALPVADWRSIEADEIPSTPTGWTVRTATPPDVETLMRLQAEAHGAVHVAVAFTRELWSYVLRSPVYRTLIAEHDGTPQACARLYLDDDDPYVLDLAGSSRAGVAAVLTGMANAIPNQALTLLDRESTRPLVGDLGTTKRSSDAYYARIGDPVAFLNAIRPELEKRLAASPLAGASGDGLVSLYAASIRFAYADGALSEFSWHPGERAPISKGGSGVAPDRFTSMLVGPLGFSGLAERYPDVNGGKQTELMETLFPPQVSDIQSWVVP
jgi:predicted N-acetyltransferase YhbS